MLTIRTLRGVYTRRFVSVNYTDPDDRNIVLRRRDYIFRLRIGQGGTRRRRRRASSDDVHRVVVVVVEKKNPIAYKTRVVNNVLNMSDIEFVSQLIYGHGFHYSVRSVESIVRARTLHVHTHLTPNQPTAAAAVV